MYMKLRAVIKRQGDECHKVKSTPQEESRLATPISFHYHNNDNNNNAQVPYLTRRLCQVLISTSYLCRNTNQRMSRMNSSLKGVVTLASYSFQTATTVSKLPARAMPFCYQSNLKVQRDVRYLNKQKTIAIHPDKKMRVKYTV